MFNYHIKKIFIDSELQENSVIRNFRITAADGKDYDTKHYGLQMIIAVGFKRDRTFVVKPDGNFISRLCSKYADFDKYIAELEDSVSG